MSSSALDVVIVSYRSRGYLPACLESLRRCDLAGLQTTVVDNGSGDGTVELVASRFPEVELVALDRNAGFAAANNLVLRQTDAPYVLLLNPDTRLEQRGSLARLIELMESRPKIGICGCRLVREDGSFDHAAKRAFPTPLSALGHFTGLSRRVGADSALASYTAPGVQGGGVVDAVNGAFMLIRRAALDRVGLFDERFWMYMEDLDLCYRFAQAGWLTWYEPSVTAVHLKGASSGRYRSLRLNYAFHYGMARFYRKHYAPRRSVAVNLAVYSGIALTLVLSAARSAGWRLAQAFRRE